MAFPKQTINSAVIKLLKAGYVYLQQIPGTKNNKQILLTEKGAYFCGCQIVPVVNATEKAFNRLSEQEREDYLDIGLKHNSFLLEELQMKQKWKLLIIAITLAAASVCSVLSPRVLGMATNQIFDGVRTALKNGTVFSVDFTTIEEAIDGHFDGYHLAHDAAADVVEVYGSEQVSFVLACTVQHLKTDGRLSKETKEWADGFLIPENISRWMDLNADYVGDKPSGSSGRFYRPCPE